MNAADLVLEGIERHFGAHVALDGLDLEVPAGSSVVLLGTSGAGKTTLLRIVAGLDAADAGRVLIGPRVLSDPDVRVPPEDRRVGMVFQALELWPHMSVAEHLAFGLPGRPRRRAALRHPDVGALAAQVGLDERLLARRPETLSGGEQQRVAIARALAVQPEVLLYDEPLANLDPDRRRALRGLIRALARERRTTLVYVTHDPDEALEIGDQVAVMEAGRIVEQAAPQTLYRSPRTLAGARALGPVTALRGVVEGGALRTALGALAVDPERLAAAAGWRGCLAVLRPEDVETSAEGTAARVEDVVVRGRDWAFRATVDGETVLGRSERPLAAGATVPLAAVAAAALVPAPPEEAA
jgi:iron(III) transport system ATP-binding protein